MNKLLAVIHEGKGKIKTTARNRSTIKQRKFKLAADTARAGCKDSFYSNQQFDKDICLLSNLRIASDPNRFGRDHG